jgi:hypothetical protein
MNPLLKAAAKHAVPRLASMTRGRRKKMVMNAGKWAAGQVLRRKRRASMGTLALRGLGVAALAVPVGMWIGKMISERGEAAGD